MKHNNIFFPIETIAREIDYKLLVASNLDSAVGDIIFAHHDLVDQIIMNSNTGVYFGKNIMNPKKINLYVKAKKNNFVIAHLDEEGGIYQGLKEDIESFIETRLNINSMKNDDRVFTWGKFQKSYFESKLQSNTSPLIFATGHPKFNYLKKELPIIYDDEKNNLVQKYGDFLLVCTTFGFSLSPYGYEDTFSERNGYGISDYKTKRLVEEWSEQMHKTAHFIELIHEISKQFPKMKIVVRNHVAEDKNFYTSSLKGLKNVIVENKGNSISWINSAKLIIHNGSTTGLEAFLLNKPVINFVFRDNPKYDSMITDKIGVKCYNQKDVIEVIKNIYSNEEQLNSNIFDSFDRDILQNLANENDSTIIKELNSIIKNQFNKNKINVSIFKIYYYEFLYLFINLIKYPIRKYFFPSKHRKYLADQRSFSGFDKKSILSKVKKIEKISNVKIKLNFVGSRIFLFKLIK